MTFTSVGHPRRRLALAMALALTSGLLPIAHDRADAGTGGPPPPPISATNPSNGHLYVATGPLAWRDAELQAVAWGGHLVTLTDAAEETWVRETFGKLEYFWIGLNDIAVEGTFVWASGEPVAYTNWCVGEPNNFNDEDAAIINWAHAPLQFGDCWNDLNPAAQLRGIVELSTPGSALVVTNTNNSGAGSLRNAMAFANAHVGAVTIVFQIPTTDPGCAAGVCTIRPLSALPPLTEGGTTIDGSTQGQTNPSGPPIVINGSASGGNGLALWSDGNQIKDLVVTAFTSGGSGIDIRGSNNSVVGSYIGLDATGTFAVENRFHGISILSGTGNVIGGSTPAARNVISGNNGQGVAIHSSRNVVRGNFIGTDRTGTRAVGNGLEGVFIWPCPFAECAGPAQGNVVGGPSSGDRNVISGNSNNGVWVQDSHNVVQGNFIGVDITGTLALGNRADGIRVVSDPGGCNAKGSCPPPTNADGNVILGNLVSANTENGIQIARFADTGPTSDENVVQGNYVGTDLTGSLALGNRGNGVAIRSGSNNTIGGTSTGARNVISGNGAAGVRITNPDSTGNLIEGNYIGLDASGTAALGNGCQGVAIQRAFRNTVGGTTPGARNVISANGTGAPVPGCVGTGVFIQGADPFIPDTANGNVVQGNYIGTDVTGTVALGNVHSGIAINFASANLIGGTAPGAGNLVSGNRANGARGIVIAGPGIATTRNVVQGNLIGTDPSGTRGVPNSTGVLINGGASGNTVGGTTPGAGNVISGNDQNGILIRGGAPVDSDANVIQANFLGTNAIGTAALPNGANGILLEGGATNTLIGGGSASARNVISGNGGQGVFVQSSTNAIEGNLIGTDVTGNGPLGNAFDGVYISGLTDEAGQPLGPPATNNVIANNVISANVGGIHLEFAENNVIRGDRVGTDASGSAGLGNSTFGIFMGTRSRSNLVGGPAPSDRNIVSGNLLVGMKLGGTGNVVEGNYIGVDASGGRALGNGFGRFAIQPGVGGPGISLVQPFGGHPPATDFLVSGNVISGNAGGGLHVGGNGNRIRGNLVGTDARGAIAIPNGSIGLAVEGTNNVIGGLTPESSNVVSGNGGGGVLLQGPRATGNSLLGNYIGTDATGTTALGNRFGVALGQGPSANVVGGSAPGAGNVISGNREFGVSLARDASGNRIEGDWIGTNAAGARLPNGSGGLLITGGASRNVIGGSAGGSNVISFNGGPGVLVSDAAVNDTISRNSIVDNAGLGIDLGGDGVTLNDPGDTDSGPNGLQNFPVLGTAEVAGGIVTLTGGLDTQSPGTATVELFGNDAADPSGYGEGQRYAASVTPAANGCFSVTFPAAAAARFFTSTATDASGNTSEFSRAIPQGTTKAAIALAPATATNVVGTTHTVSATLTNTAGGPVPCAAVTFTVSGANTASGTSTTDINGTTSFTYMGVWAGDDAITAISGPAKGTATKTWTFPASTAGSVTGGGQVATPTSTASFGITATGATGQLELNERAGRNVHSTRIAATVITGTHATVYGFGTVDGAGDVQFRVVVDDSGEPGTSDAFRIVMRDGYTAGGVLQRGKVQVR